MNKGNFIPKTDIEAYLNSNFNIEIYEDLTESEDWNNTFEPLEFLNLLYEQFEIVNANKEKPISVKNHLMKLDLEKPKLFFLLYYLKRLIYQFAGNPDKPKDQQLNICLGFIRKEYATLENELFPRTEPEPDPEPKSETEFDFDEVKQHLDTIQDPKEKIKYLVDQKTKYEQDGRFVLEFPPTFADKCQMEISKIKSLLDLETPPTQPVIKPQLGKYSNSQLVLIFYYFFKFNGLEPRVSIDIAPIAKFIHLIIGKEFKATTNSDFYKKLQAAPNFKTDKELIKDLEAIKPLFKKVQLNEIVKMIDNEIDIARAELKQKKY